MSTVDDDNLTNEQKIALDWISMIESPEANRVREIDLYPKLRRWLSCPPGEKVLEIGAGQGICSDKIDFRNLSYTGLEISPTLVDRARQLYEQSGRKFLLGSALKIPCANGEFDSIFSVSVWHLLQDINKASLELHRVLKPGGRFLIITANPDAYATWTEPYQNVEQVGTRFEGTLQLSDNSVVLEVLYLHSKAEILSSLQNAGLEVQSVETFRPVQGSLQFERFILIEGHKPSS